MNTLLNSQRRGEDPALAFAKGGDIRAFGGVYDVSPATMVHYSAV
jgi:hypothetical protein